MMETSIKVRLLVLLLLSIGTIGFLFYRTGYIIVAYGDDYGKEVQKRSMQVDSTIPALRGNIKDRNGEYLAKSVKAYNIILDVRLLLTLDEDEQNKTINGISKELDLPVYKLWQIVNNNKTKAYRLLRKKVSIKFAKNIESMGFKGIWLEETADRLYPNNHLASQVIGFLGEGIGRYGVEETYDSWLQGVPGRRLMVTTDNGLRDIDYISPTDGNDITLTIDETIQHFVETAMKSKLVEYQPANASAIVIDPNTGEILAMASYPTVDPNTRDEAIGYYGKIPFAELSDSEQRQVIYGAWANYNISSTYEPGSTFKPLVYAMGLEEGVITGRETFYCGGKKIIYGVTLPCWKKTGHGEQTMDESIANSCNIAVMEIAEKLGRKTFYSYMKNFGSGQMTHIDLIGEPKNYDAVVYKEKQLNPVELATSSFGQGSNMTPIQLIMANAAVVNGGYLLEPRVVSQIVGSDGIVVKEMSKRTIRKVISKETSDKVRKAMEAVVDVGTGKSAQIAGYRIGGKTGTAEKGNREIEDYIVSFLSYAPVDDPKVMMLVILDQGDKEVKSKMAVEISKEIYKDILPLLEIYPNISTPN